MPDTRQHRGAHPSDARLFEASKLAELRTANFEFSWLLSRGYSPASALKLVGDRHKLNKRQRVALSRAACSDREKETRQAKCLEVQAIKAKEIVVDGFNLLITLEAALAGGLILCCRDGCIRDLASVHGSYRSVEETQQAIKLVGRTFEALAPQSVEWLFDKPVSNSGRLAQQIRQTADEQGWPWTTEVVLNPDTTMIKSSKIAVSSDSSILDNVTHWINFSAYILAKDLPHAWIIDLH